MKKDKKIILIISIILLILSGTTIYSISNKNSLLRKFIRANQETEITYTLNPEGYTNQSAVNIFIKAINSNGIKTIEFIGENDKIIANGRTEVGIDYKVTKNGTYTFKITDINNKEKTQNVVIDTIDTIEPTIATVEAVTIGETKVKVKLNAEDGETTENSVKSGIDKYEIYVNGGKVGESTEDTYIIRNLNKTTTYSIYVIAYDRAGNHKKSETMTLTTTEGVYPTIKENTIDFPDEVLLASNAIDVETYDNDDGTYSSYMSGSAFAYVDESAWTKILKVKYSTLSLQPTMYVRCMIMISYDEFDKEIARTLNPGQTAGAVIDYEFEIPEGCKKVMFYLSEGGNFYIYNIEIKENEDLNKNAGTYRSLIPVMENTTVKNRSCSIS